jgi:excinuclease ABC subunit C
LAAVRATQGANPQTFAEADLFAIHTQGGASCIQVFFFRAHQNWGNRAYFPRHEQNAEPGEILEAFIAQFYDDRTPSPLVLTSVAVAEEALLAEALSMKAERNVEVSSPQRGEKREIMNQAVLNAREALARRMAEGDHVARLLDGVAQAFDLPERPERIEVYDNSHIQGSNAVGAYIVAGPDGFQKSQYRKYNFKEPELTPGDDYAMMREVLRRRFTRILKDAEEASATTPDEVKKPAVREGGVDFSKAEKERTMRPHLILIDGGEGQLQAVLGVMSELGLSPRDIPIVGIAKGVDRDAGREQFFMPGRAPFRLEEKSPVLYYLQRLRDEAHRFAIGAHRAKRKAEMGRNPLDEIEGVGPSRKRALLSRFGSASSVARAALADLRVVPGIDEALAQRIYDHFRGA